MPCCGSARRKGAENPQAPAGTIRVERHVYQTAVFQYTGRTRLTAVGAGTKRVYRFDGPGARAIVDGRDVASVAGIPNLIRA
jgi:hypothetical protein